MRWRFVDKIDRFEPWTSIVGRKMVSLEEYCLYEPLGREGVLPEVLALESCVGLLRWLVVKSSDFRETCLLHGVENFAFQEEVGMGQALSISATVLHHHENTLVADCRVRAGDNQVAEGTLEVGLLALSETSVPDEMEILWQELYAST